MRILKPLKLGWMAEACGGRVLQGNPDTEALTVCIDSRKITPGALFVSIVGERTDAHRFLAQAEEKGAAVCLVQENNPHLKSYLEGAHGDMGLIEVPDTVAALQQIAGAFRSTLRIPLIGVTGSVGKTTTREMIADALSASFSVYRTPENHNSQIGVPVTLLETDPAAEIAVIEMGMSIPGEMTRLSAMVRPDAAVFTNIGDAHIEQLGSREGILEEKSHIQDGMKSGSPVFVNGEDVLLARAEFRPDLEKICLGGEGSEIRAEAVSMEGGCASFTAVVSGKRVPVRLHVYGQHQIQNALAALAVTARFGGSLEGAAEKLSGFLGYRHRQQIFSHNGITVVDDSYNASPASMTAALRVLGSISCEGKRAAVLADMLELGPEELSMHAEVGQVLGEERLADVLYLLGSRARAIGEAARRAVPELPVRCFDSLESLKEALEADLKQGDCVLFKGSNSMGLSKLADYFSGSEPGPSH